MSDTSTSTSDTSTSDTSTSGTSLDDTSASVTNAGGTGTRDKLVTCVWFDRGQARQAAEFYTRTFPDSHVGATMAAPGDHPGGKQGDELTVEFTVLGRPFLGLNGGPEFRPNESVSFMVLTDSQEETDRYWAAITQGGGQESECGWCKDRWGFSWQITPRALLEGMRNPDPAAAKRVMQAMMTMKKIDIAAIRRAERGEAVERGEAADA